MSAEFSVGVISTAALSSDEFSFVVASSATLSSAEFIPTMQVYIFNYPNVHL